MKTISVILEWAELGALMVVKEIEKKFPCWTFIKDIDEDYFELTIDAREEDIPVIEKMLAPFV